MNLNKRLYEYFYEFQMSTQLAKPKLRGLHVAQVKKNLIVAITAGIAIAALFKVLVCDKRKQRYVDFYKYVIILCKLLLFYNFACKLLLFFNFFYKLLPINNFCKLLLFYNLLINIIRIVIYPPNL